MSNSWRKARAALAMCGSEPRTEGHEAAAHPGSDARSSNNTDTSSTSDSVSASSKTTCAICLDTMKPGHGQALFTAECSHSFHFHCIASSVKHGNQLCPVCRSNWKELPFNNPFKNPFTDNGRIDTFPRLPYHGPRESPFQSLEPSTVFDDDEEIDANPGETAHHCSDTVEIKTCPESSSLGRSTAHENFALLVHLKAPVSLSLPQSSSDHGASSSIRTPVDLVTVLDISGSMAGYKLALLKRAMGFVIQNLGSSDRLSVIAFSSVARRLFPLRRMTDAGKQLALQAVNSLTSNCGTNIAEGLKKGAKVMEDRKSKNPVAGIILLSDGQDTYNLNSLNPATSRPDYRLLLPTSISNENGRHIPVHTFGFGADHDPASMHFISEASGGTFSFIETESFIQDAFAQCIGGLLSVVVQELRLVTVTTDSRVRISSMKAGSYGSCLSGDGHRGIINVGDMYAEEERDFLLFLNVPAGEVEEEETSLVKVSCSYKNPITKETLNADDQVVIIRRVASSERSNPSIEVDRQRNRIQATEAMANARAFAEQNDLAAAVSTLEKCRKELTDSASFRAGDNLCISLDAELKELQEKMATRPLYESSGRAMMLSGLSSHTWQRATTRGDSTADGSSVGQAYQTPSMVGMVSASRSMPLVGAPNTTMPLVGAPSTAMPWAGAPSTSMPLVGAPSWAGSPSTAMPWAGAPSISMPLVGAPSTSMPLVGAPSTAMPWAGAPSTSMPLVGAPNTSIPPLPPPSTTLSGNRNQVRNLS